MAARNYIAAIERTLRVITAFDGQDPMSLAKLAAQSELVKSSVFRILYTLADLGYVKKDSRGLYSLTARWGRIGRSRPPADDLVRRAAPLIAGLHGLFHETVNLGVLDQGEVLYIHVLESPHAFRLAAHAGMRSPAHSTALGKCLLSGLSHDELEALLNNHPLRPQTKRTVRDLAGLERDLKRVRERGYALDDGEDSPGARCIAAPISDGEGRVVAAISVSGPAGRVHRGRDREMSTALKDVCARISRQLSYAGNARSEEASRRP
jgi:DNA-binding IclR family transcriptional regulator